MDRKLQAVPPPAPIKRPVGRPRKVVDEGFIYRLARIHCTVDEIATITGVSKNTLDRNYGDVLKRGRENGKASLRRMQYKAAKAGNAALLIWLGKQLLGQRERLEHTGEDGGPIQVALADAILRDADR